MPTPIHGALGWECIHYGVDGRFYLCRFEDFQLGDPGCDLGGFAADLLCFALAQADQDAARTGLAAFLGAYNAKAAHPLDEEELRCHAAVALVERLGRPEFRAHVTAGTLLRSLEAVLADVELGETTSLSGQTLKGVKTNEGITP